MENVASRFFLDNWQRKTVALLTALIIWIFVNHSILETKVIPSVPIRLINLPPDKTAIGLLPNGILSKRITLTLSGTKDVINELEPGDIVVVVDASTIDRDDWVLQVTKKNLISLNPSIDLLHHITDVKHTEYILKLSKMVTEKIPITILPPTGEPPAHYEFLDIWPQHLMQTVSGPEESIKALKNKGLEVSFDLNEITQKDLDDVKSSSSASSMDDEITYLIPASRKLVAIPFHNNALEEINDPEAEFLRIDFLRKEFHPVDQAIPIRLFYPIPSLNTINPETLNLTSSAVVQKEKGIFLFKHPFFIYGVSKLFVDIIRENIEITIIAANKEEGGSLDWSVELIDPRALEDAYAAFLMANGSLEKKYPSFSKAREEMLRKRFRDFLQKIVLYSSSEKKLRLDNRVEGHFIKVKVD